MIKHFILATVALALVGCAGKQHPNCPAVQQAERQNAKDLQAYCFSKHTQDSFKCEEARLQAARLLDARNRMQSDSYFDPILGGDRGPNHSSYALCAPVL